MVPGLRSARTAVTAAIVPGVVVTLACGGAHAGDVCGIVSFGHRLLNVENFYSATVGASPASFLNDDEFAATTARRWGTRKS